MHDRFRQAQHAGGTRTNQLVDLVRTAEDKPADDVRDGQVGSFRHWLGSKGHNFLDGLAFESNRIVEKSSGPRSPRLTVHVDGFDAVFGDPAPSASGTNLRRFVQGQKYLVTGSGRRTRERAVDDDDLPVSEELVQVGLQDPPGRAGPLARGR